MSRVLLCGFAFLYAHVLSSGHARRHAPVCFEYVYIYPAHAHTREGLNGASGAKQMR